jgi:hypothetical protein
MLLGRRSVSQVVVQVTGVRGGEAEKSKRPVVTAHSGDHRPHFAN